jgi:hypothetical protein
MRGPARGPAPTVDEDDLGRRRIHVDGHTLVVCQVYYDERSRLRVDPMYTPYLNMRLGPFFESSVIADLLAAGYARAVDYLGVFSWRFAAKIPLDARAILQRLRRDGFAADVYSFFGRIEDRRLWVLAEAKHPGILRAAAALLHRLGMATDLPRLSPPIVYQNHFLCRAPLYERFGRELLVPALRAMSDEADGELQTLLRQDACYHDPRVTPAALMAIFGRPHFCLHPFIAERLFSTWLALNPDVRVRHIWRGRFVEAGKIPYEPEMRRPP